jgi:hypothetical protein
MVLVRQSSPPRVGSPAGAYTPRAMQPPHHDPTWHAPQTSVIVRLPQAAPRPQPSAGVGCLPAAVAMSERGVSSWMSQLACVCHCSNDAVPMCTASNPAAGSGCVPSLTNKPCIDAFAGTAHCAHPYGRSLAAARVAKVRKMPHPTLPRECHVALLAPSRTSHARGSSLQPSVRASSQRLRELHRRQLRGRHGRRDLCPRRASRRSYRAHDLIGSPGQQLGRAWQVATRRRASDGCQRTQLVPQP